MDLSELFERSKAVWGLGDYTPTSKQLEPASEQLVETLNVSVGERVLDVAAGHGNCAIAAVRRGASVAALDFSPTMVEAGRKRTLGLDVEWHEGDAAYLPFEDASFDKATSVFGAIFALEQDQTASDVVRVLRSGGTYGFTSWPPDGYVAEVLAVTGKHRPPRTPDTPDSFRWGRPDEVDEIFRSLGCTTEVRPRTITFVYDSLEDWRTSSEAHGGAVVAKQMLSPETYNEVYEELTALARKRNRGEGGRVMLDADYLEFVVTKP